MIERVTVMSRPKAVRYTRKKHVPDTAAMVSIASACHYYSSRPRPCNHVPFIGRFTFDDIVPGEDGCPMTDTDARQIAKFVADIEENGVTHIIIHCDAGVSRSAGVAKAIAESRGLPETAVHYENVPNPNPHVYRFMKEALSE